MRHSVVHAVRTPLVAVEMFRESTWVANPISPNSARSESVRSASFAWQRPRAALHNVRRHTGLRAQAPLHHV